MLRENIVHVQVLNYTNEYVCIYNNSVKYNMKQYSQYINQNKKIIKEV